MSGVQILQSWAALVARQPICRHRLALAAMPSRLVDFRLNSKLRECKMFCQQDRRQRRMQLIIGVVFGFEGNAEYN